MGSARTRAPTTPAIAFANVTYGDGAAPVLDGISLAVRQREFLAIVGPSGAGTTTLLPSSSIGTAHAARTRIASTTVLCLDVSP